MAETKKPVVKKTTTKKPTTTTTPRKKPSTTKSSTTKKTSGTTSKKPSSVTTKKPSSTTTKKTTAKTNKTPVKVQKGTTVKTGKEPTKKTAMSKVPAKPKKAVNGIKIEKNVALERSKPKVAPIKKVTKPRKKATPRVKKQEELTTLELVEQKIEGKEIVERKPLGKTFYLIFSIVFYLGTFFYINNVYFTDGDLVQSALFSLAALFVVFVLILFNIHRIVIGFFVLPMRRLIKQARHEVNKEIYFSVGKNKIQTTFNKYRTIFTFVLYLLIALLLLYATISEGLDTNETVLKIITKSFTTELVFIVVLCSWQYLFNILPEVLDQTIDAKNGYILTLSAIVMIIFVVFNIFNVTYLSEIMIFILIIGFIALLGVNLNMIVGEINIFNNIRNRRDKTVTRLVFTIFFSFHIYIILYASVVAFSIYQWNSESFNFSSNPTEEVVIEDVYDFNQNLISDDIYYYDTVLTTNILVEGIYDSNGEEITEYLDNDLNPPQDIYSDSGFMINQFTTSEGLPLDFLYSEDQTHCIQNTIYYDGQGLGCKIIAPMSHEYGDFLYWTVISVSTIGYGDIAPSTEYPIAMGWGAFLGLYGLTFFALSISFVSNIAMEGINAGKKD